MTTVQTLKGFRDFLPEEKRKRDFVAQKMRTVYQRFGFSPLETPTLEYADLLLGKYGEEADKLVYKFLDRGEREVALRYDQTVPTARILAQYQNELPKYFRRYQIQNVFRADKPQRGRYREFTQSDCDIFGSTSPIADAEILAVFYAVYKELGLGSLVIELNDRQTLFGTLGVFANPKTDVFSLCQTIDKSDKLSEADLTAELLNKGLNTQQVTNLYYALKNAEMSSELAKIVDNAVALGVPREALKFNPKLARGLDYYTGLIFEGRVPEYPVGSVGGGGRYDSLIEQLAGVTMPAVGFGIGFDRTVEAVEQQGLIPTEVSTAQVMVTVFEGFEQTALSAAQKLRKNGVSVEVFPGVEKLGKQFKLADQKSIPFAVIVGEQEVANNQLQLKNLQSGEQQQLTLEQVVAKLK